MNAKTRKASKEAPVNCRFAFAGCNCVMADIRMNVLLMFLQRGILMMYKRSCCSPSLIRCKGPKVVIGRRVKYASAKGHQQ
jgi:hypothetical protein